MILGSTDRKKNQGIFEKSMGSCRGPFWVVFEEVPFEQRLEYCEKANPTKIGGKY